MKDAFIKPAAGLDLVDAAERAAKMACLNDMLRSPDADKTIVFNVLDLMAETPGRKSLWFQTIVTAIEIGNRVILALPRHNPAMDELIELQLRHALPEAVTGALRHGSDGHILVSYDELKAGEKGPLGQPAADIFVSALTTTDDFPYAAHIAPADDFAVAWVKMALRVNPVEAHAGQAKGWLDNGPNGR